VSSLSDNIRLSSHVLTPFVQSQSDDNGSIPQPSAWFPILDRASI
jgi:hypothetical protein